MGDRSALLDCAQAFSPQLEQTASDTITLDVSGLNHLIGSPQDIAAAIAQRARDAGLQANIAIAPNPDAAIHAARGFAGVTIISRGEELESLPLHILSL